MNTTLQQGTPQGGAVNMSGESSLGNPTQAAAALEGTVSENGPPSKEATQDDRKYHESFVKLMKKERELQRQQAEWKSRKTEMDAALKRAKEFDDAREQAKTNPLAAARLLEIDYKKLTDQILNDERPTTEMELGALKEQLQRLQDEKRLEKERIEQTQSQQAVETFKTKTADFLESFPDKYEVLKAYGGVDQVLEVMWEHHQEYGELPSVVEVADMVEERMAAQLDAEYDRLKKLRRYTPQEIAELAEESMVSPEASKAQPKTLTNQMGSTAPVLKSSGMSVEDSKKKAAELLRWT